MIKSNGGKGLHRFSFDLSSCITVMVVIATVIISYYATTGEIKEEIVLQGAKITALTEQVVDIKGLNGRQEDRINQLFDEKADKP